MPSSEKQEREALANSMWLFRWTNRKYSLTSLRLPQSKIHVSNHYSHAGRLYINNQDSIHAFNFLPHVSQKLAISFCNKSKGFNLKPPWLTFFNNKIYPSRIYGIYIYCLYRSVCHRLTKVIMFPLITPPGQFLINSLLGFYFLRYLECWFSTKQIVFNIKVTGLCIIKSLVIIFLTAFFQIIFPYAQVTFLRISHLKNGLLWILQIEP